MFGFANKGKRKLAPLSFDAFFFLPLHWARAHHMTSIVWLCIVLSKHVLLQIIFCSCVVNETSLLSEKWFPCAVRMY